MPLWIRDDEVAALVGMPEALATVEAALARQGAGQATNLARRRVAVPGSTLNVMAAADAGAGLMALKSYTTAHGRFRFHVLLYRAEDGELLAVVEASHLGRLRTGAASGVASRRLANPGTTAAAVFGSGYQARTQVEALAHACGVTDFRVYSRDPERRRVFCETLCAQLGLWVTPAESPAAALEGAGIVSTITSSPDPVFDGALLRPGMHVNAAGSNSLLRRELDERALRVAGLVVVDSREGVALEAGDLLPGFQKGFLHQEALVELHEVVSGRHPGRTAPEQITLFKSLGIALEDLALAGEVYRRATAAGAGAPISVPP